MAQSCLLEKLNIQDASTYLHHIVDCICGRKSKSCVDFEHSLTLEEWWTLNDCYDSLLREAVMKSYSVEKISQELGSLTKEYKHLVETTLNIRRDDILKRLQNDASLISQTVLKDFDWQMKLIMSSDKLAAVHEPVLSLELDLKSEKQERSLSLELNRNELKKFISSLEAANRAVQQLKS